MMTSWSSSEGRRAHSVRGQDRRPTFFRHTDLLSSRATPSSSNSATALTSTPILTRPDLDPTRKTLSGTPILPRPDLDHLHKASSSLSTKREALRSRLRRNSDRVAPDGLGDALSFDDDAVEGAASLNASFAHHSTQAPLSPIKSSLSQSRVFHRPREDVARVVSFKSSSLGSASRRPRLSALYDDKLESDYLRQCFEVGEKIGEGSFGEVFRVKSRDDGRFYAVKRSRGAFRGSGDRKEKLSEVAKYEKLEAHPNCVRFYLAWEERRRLYIQTELCLTNLQQLVAAEGKEDRLTESRVWDVALDLLAGVKHLHDAGLVHFDVKPDNVFVSRDGRRDVYKLGDFGLVKDVGVGGQLDDAREGDPKYLAPEMLEGRFTRAADVFSLGMTLLELASGLELPSNGEAWHKLRGGAWNPEEFKTEHLSLDLQTTIRRMLDPRPESRATVDELLQAPEVMRAAKRRRLRFTLVAFADSLVGLLRLVMLLALALWERLVRLPTTLVARRVLGLTSFGDSKKTALPYSTPDGRIDPPPESSSSVFLRDASFSDDEVFDFDSRRKNISSNRLFDAVRERLIDSPGPAAALSARWRGGLSQSPGQQQQQQNTSASSSILAAPLNQSRSPTSERSRPSFDAFHLDDSQASSSTNLVVDGDADSLPLEDLDGAYEGATPPPKHPRPKTRQVGMSDGAIKSTVGTESGDSPFSRRATPSHHVSDSPFRAPLSVSTPRQKPALSSGAAELEKPGVESSGAENEENNDGWSLRRRESTGPPARLTDDLTDDGREWRLVDWLVNDVEGFVRERTPSAEQQSTSVGPKNLLTLFDNVSDDEVADAAV